MNRLVLILMGALLFFFCGKEKGTNNNSFSGISSIIYETDGKKPAFGAIVKFFNTGSGDSTPIASDTTDDQGRYTIAELPVGMYNIWAEKDSFVLLQDSIRITSSAYSNIPAGTLRRASSLIGSVTVHPCHDPRIVSILVIGSDKQVTIASKQGNFSLTGLAAGTHTLLIRTTMSGYTQMRETVTIADSVREALDHPLDLVYSGFPMVTEIRIREDTLNHAVMLSWDPVQFSTFQDYVIYRDTCKDFNFSNEILYATDDTFFLDSTYHPPDAYSQHCLEYRIAVRNDEQNIGPTCQSARITFAPKTYVTTTFWDSVDYPDPNPKCDTATINDMIRLIVVAYNPTRSLVSLAWCDPVKKYTVTTIDAKGLSLKRLTDTIELAFDSVGINRPFVIVTDDAGTEWYDTIPVRIVPDPPIVDAGHDTGVLVGATAHLHGRAVQRFGTIAEWKWKIGPGNWIKTNGPDIDIVTPLTEGVTVCSLSATDDDWNRATDELLLITTMKAQSIASGGFFNLILKLDGTLLASGYNDYGQLGDGTLVTRGLPVAVMSDVQSMAAGFHHSLILKTDGTLWTCGGNEYGQLCDGTTSKQYSPIPIASEVRDIAAGFAHSLILKKDGTVWACGDNEYGQLGDSTKETRHTPVQVMNNAGGLAAGAFHSLILAADGTAWSCGENGGGQLGDGTTEDRTTPVPVMSNVRSVAAGGWHSFFLKKDGTLWACGNNGYGQIGDGTLERRVTPVPVMTEVRSMVTNMFFSLVLRNDGVLWFCGLNPIKLLIDPNSRTQHAPLPIMTDVQSMAAGWYHSLILKTDGTVWACGINDFFQLGDGTTTSRLQPICVFPPQSAIR